MALPPSVQSGQSNSPQYSQRTFFAEQGYTAPGYQTGNIIGAANPASAIDNAIRNITVPPALTFPSDLPKYFSYIIQSRIVGTTSNNLQVTRAYKLPLPLQLNRQHEVNYDANFNYLSVLPEIAQRVLQSNVSRGAQALLGLSINNFKNVVLSVPDFQTFQMVWKLSPKNFNESQEIQRIINGIQTGMHPPTTQAAGINLTFGFPDVFSVGLIPNSKYLFKMKPAVITSINIDYNGGQPVPSFYKSQENSSENSPPESVTITMNFLELEYWTRQSFENNTDGTGLPTANPFVSNWFTYTNPAVVDQPPRQNATPR